MSNNSKDALKKLDSKIAQLQMQKKALVQKEKLKEKRERAKSMIECAEIAEKYFEMKISPVMFEKFLQQLLDVPNVKSHVNKIKTSLAKLN